MTKNFYDILGVQRNACDDEIKSAFRNKAKNCHPDHCGDGGKAAFIELMEAYETLGDMEKRQAYDARFNVSSSRQYGRSPIEPMDESHEFYRNRRPVVPTEMTFFDELVHLMQGLDREGAVFRTLEQFERENLFFNKIIDQFDELFQKDSPTSLNSFIQDLMNLFTNHPRRRY